MTKLASLENQLAAVPKLGQRELHKQYRDLYGKPAPVQSAHELLQNAVASRLHQQLYATMRGKMMQALTAAEAILSILANNSSQTELVREWRGRIHVVTLVSDGVLYRGQHYRSLSAVAHKITGKRISGDAFFGLRESGATASSDAARN